ncbi:SpoIID/LytB domain-containing protein [Proteinivorax hydrogeniformans]|uniref:SpoIID/LytB domain-containing protein n=1 Tax=Proteinivorax hydrogeniformans TaxID=1826727 RepID=A0AAU8HR71_9FIRM
MKRMFNTKLLVTLVVVSICSSFFYTGPGIQFAEASHDEIRVGLFFGNNALRTVNLDSNNSNTLKANYNNAEHPLYSGVGEFEFSLTNVNKTSTVFSDSDISKVREIYNQLSNSNVPVFYGFNGLWHVLVPSHRANEVTDINPSLRASSFSVASQVVKVENKGRTIAYFEQIDNNTVLRLHSDDEFISVNDGSRYRGFMEVLKENDGFKVINQLDMELYLRGVVPYEMSPSWPIEALAAQTVAARTYAVRNWNKYKSRGFNVCTTVNSQVYRGYNSRHETSRVVEAIEKTEGEIITFNGNPIDAVYHSHSGGHTENSENVWGGTLTYLRGVKDPYSVRSGSMLDDWAYETVIEGVDEHGRAGFKDELVSRGHLDSSFDIADIEVVTFDSGRVDYLLLTSEQGEEVKIRSGQIFGAFHNNTSPGGSQRLWSRVFDVKMDSNTFIQSTLGIKQVSGDAFTVLGEAETSVVDGKEVYVLTENGKTSLPTRPHNITLDGSGWGHGVGMSQWGARQMAVEGYSYREILEYYYRQIDVR